MAGSGKRCICQICPHTLWGLVSSQEDPEAVKSFGVDVGTEMSRRLLDGGVAGLHFYTLNLEKVRSGFMSEVQLAAFIPKSRFRRGRWSWASCATWVC